ncbi:hypothetical protein SLEP1_g17153 [Rubroshorea leprosula]|uniref:Uncharacterized protein n=1 Tax=Rubroshorea leprosula TaxID=152421 RepID=A0AAV5J2F5_9ROSI|nr:hypothetical protein SLEP1_g17153 [Rubroshorea leprosula]
MLFPRLLLDSLIVFFLANFVFASLLPDDELRAFREIAKTLGKTDRDISIDPCNERSGLVTPNADEGFKNAVTCSNDTIPHIVSM